MTSRDLGRGDHQLTSGRATDDDLARVGREVEPLLFGAGLDLKVWSGHGSAVSQDDGDVVRGPLFLGEVDQALAGLVAVLGLAERADDGRVVDRAGEAVRAEEENVP